MIRTAPLLLLASLLAVAPCPAAGPAPTTVCIDASLNPWPVDGTHAVVRAIWALNDRRVSRGLGNLLPDDGLIRAANAGARRIALGQETPHASFPARVRAEGWPQMGCGVRSGFGNLAEGVGIGGLTPEECVLALDAAADPAEGHRRDFEDPRLTHIGVGFAPATAGPYAGYRVVVIDYGSRCR